MANEARLIDAKPLMQNGWHLVQTGESNKFLASMSLADVPTVDAVPVVQIEKVKQEILQTLDILIATHLDISNSQFSNCEKSLGIPKSSNDYYGIKAEAYETARRLVNAALIDLCDNCGAKMDGDGNGN